MLGSKQSKSRRGFSPVYCSKNDCLFYVNDDFVLQTGVGGCNSVSAKPLTWPASGCVTWVKTSVSMAPG